MVTEHVPGSRSAAVGLWVGAGARDETALQAGAAHFLEHVLFKRTPTRTAAQIAEQVDAVGGELNAFTTKEYTCFYAHVLDRDARLAVDVVTDVALRGLCRADDIELERQVVLEEIAMRDEDPEDLLADLLDEAMFTGHALSRPVIGTPESVTAMNRRRITGFHRRRYRPEKMVLAVAGNVDHDTVLRAVTEALADRTDGPTTGAAAPAPPRPRRRPGVIVRDHDGEQAHLSVAVRTPGRAGEADRWPLAVLNHVLGGGLSSRLFQRVREDRGLAYSVYSAVDTYTEAGALSVYAGCQPGNLGAVADQVSAVLDEIATGGITETELARARGGLRGAMVLGMEDTSARMNRLGVGQLLSGRPRSLDEALGAIDAVTAEDVGALATRLLAGPRGGVVLGPYDGPAALPGPARRLLGR